uniref:TALPID3 protein n=1 Tax=Ciona intestinalis TaxID=7719 RepID=UPI000180B042|nr:TALPID3 protein [Ciona intestinalis]|eukprot:XP_002121173.1 TALPID3 protein [Ciona intestinalis]
MRIHSSAHDLEREIERQEISKQFPGSLSEYLQLQPTSAETACLPLTVKKTVKTSDGYLFRAKLKELERIRRTLDGNISVAQRGQENIFSDMLNTENQESSENRARKLVNEAISAVSPEIKQEVILELEAEKKKSKFTNAKASAMRKQDTHPHSSEKNKKIAFGKTLKVKNSVTTHPIKKSEKRLKKSNIKTTDNEIYETEPVVTHVYGKGGYHTHRSTVHQPYFHTGSPFKQPKFRTKRAIEHIPVSYVKSEKSQTVSCNTQQIPSYYFNPSSPVSPLKIKTQSTPGNLLPLAVALGPPKIIENSPVPVIVPINNEVDSPPKPVVIKLSEKPSPTPVANIEISKNIDTSVSYDSSIVKTEDDDQHDLTPVQLDGSKKKENKGEKLPLLVTSTQPVMPSANLAERISQEEAENYTKHWVEQEIMARILHELYKPKPQGTEASFCENFLDKPIKYLVDPGREIDRPLLQNLIEEEIRDMIRTMTTKKEPSSEQAISQNESVDQTPTQPRIPVVPVTPAPSPPHSPLPHHHSPNTHEHMSPMKAMIIHTPSITPEASMSESIHEVPQSPVSVPSSESIVEEEMPKINIVSTPDVTPPPTPCVEYEPVLRQSVSEASEPIEPIQLDNWNGVVLPLPEDTNFEEKKMFKPLKPSSYEPDLEELVVRTLTPVPIEKSVIISESDESVSSDESNIHHADATISEGQLLISHGEMRPRKRPIKAPEKIKNFIELGLCDSMESTLKDTPQINIESDADEISEGQYNPMERQRKSFWPYAKVEKKHEMSVYEYESPKKATRSKYPYKEDDVSIGEVSIGNSRKEKFRQWKEARSPKVHDSRENNSISERTDLQIEDLDPGHESFSEMQHTANNVIMVAPLGTNNKEQNERLPVPSKDFHDAIDDVGAATLTTTMLSESTIVKDSLEASQEKREKTELKKQSRMLLTIPSAVNSTEIDSDIETDDLSVHEFDF